jgi:hypothetical protein
MGKNEIIAVQTDFLYFPPPVLHSHNPTDYNIDSYSSPCSEKDDGVFYSDKWQKGAAKDAKLLGGIRLYDLVFILAKEECYNDTLPKLWDLSGFNNDTLNRFPQWNEVIAKNRQGRAWAWFWLLCRWTIFEKPRYGNIESINEIIQVFKRFNEQVTIKDDYDVLAATLVIGRMHDQKNRVEPREVPPLMGRLKEKLKESVKDK